MIRSHRVVPAPASVSSSYVPRDISPEVRICLTCPSKSCKGECARIKKFKAKRRLKK